MWLMLPGNVTTCYLHILFSKNICQVIFVPNGVCPLTIDVRPHALLLFMLHVGVSEAHGAGIRNCALLV